MRFSLSVIRVTLSLSFVGAIATTKPAAQALPVQVIEPHAVCNASMVSLHYAVHVQIGGVWTPVDTYGYTKTTASNVNNYPTSGTTGGVNTSVHWASLGLSHSARIRVTSLRTTSTPLELRPFRIAMQRPTGQWSSGGLAGKPYIEYTIQAGQSTYVRRDDQQVDTMFVFASKPKPPTPQGASSATGPTVLGSTWYFPRGTWAINTAQKFPVGVDTVYLDSGAWVNGSFDMTDYSGTPTMGLSIVGPGVLSAPYAPNGQLATWEFVKALSTYEQQAKYNLISLPGASLGQPNPITIEGPALVGSPFFNLDLQNAAGPKAISDVHIISPWSYNTDAFDVGSRATISKCFAFINDDVFSPEWVKFQYAGQFWDISISDCVTAGRNHVNVGYGMFGTSPGVPMTDNYATLSNIDVVLHLPLPDTVPTGLAPGVIKSRVGNATTRVTALENTIVRNLRVQGDVHRLFYMKNDGGFSSPPKFFGNTVNILFENVELIGVQAAKSELDGYDVSNMLRVEFRNLVIGGTRVTAANASTYFNIGPYAVATFN